MYEGPGPMVQIKPTASTVDILRVKTFTDVPAATQGIDAAGGPLCDKRPQPASWAASSAGASASDGPYQVRCRPETSAQGVPGKASGPSSGVNR